MKKSLVVLLIVVLAVGSAFAAISGKFTGTYSYDIDNSKLDWNTANGTEFEFEVVADTKETANEGEVYAKLAAKVEFNAVDTDLVDVKKSSTDEVGKIIVGITEASINGADWKLDLYADIKAPNYAKSAIDTYKKDNKDTAVDFTPAIFANLKGIKFKKAGYSAGFVAKYAGAETVGLVGETKEFVSGDIKAQAAAAFSTVASVKTVAGSVKAAYGEIATVAADMQYAADTFDYEVAANVKYAPVTFDFYYSSAVVTGATNNPKFLSAKLVADLAEYAPAKLTVTGKNLLATKTFDVEVETTAIADTTLTVYGKDLLTNNKLGAKAVYTGVEKTKLTLDASYALATKAIAAAFDAEYTADLYTATFGADFGYEKAASLALDASVKSTKLVSGATLKLAWDSVKLLGAKAALGKVTASCEIAFK